MIVLLTSVIMHIIYAYNIKCPSAGHWNMRAKGLCSHVNLYVCLLNNDGLYTDNCIGSELATAGTKLTLNRGYFDKKNCSNEYYQPFIFSTNGNSNCAFQKSICNDGGLFFHDNGSIVKDRTCRCDYTKGYAFVTSPENRCFCIPKNEDCSCYVKSCGDKHILTPDYNCVAETDIKAQLFHCPWGKTQSLEPQQDAKFSFIEVENIKGVENSSIVPICVVIVLIVLFLSIILVIKRIKSSPTSTGYMLVEQNVRNPSYTGPVTKQFQYSMTSISTETAGDVVLLKTEATIALHSKLNTKSSDTEIVEQSSTSSYSTANEDSANEYFETKDGQNRHSSIEKESEEVKTKWSTSEIPHRPPRPKKERMQGTNKESTAVIPQRQSIKMDNEQGPNKGSIAGIPCVSSTEKESEQGQKEGSTSGGTTLSKEEAVDKFQSFINEIDVPQESPLEVQERKHNDNCSTNVAQQELVSAVQERKHESKPDNSMDQEESVQDQNTVSLADAAQETLSDAQERTFDNFTTNESKPGKSMDVKENGQDQYTGSSADSKLDNSMDQKENDKDQNTVSTSDATQEALSEVQERKHDNNSSTNDHQQDSVLAVHERKHYDNFSTNDTAQESLSAVQERKHDDNFSTNESKPDDSKEQKDNDQGQNLVFSTDATQEALSEVQKKKHDNNSSTNDAPQESLLAVQERKHDVSTNETKPYNSKEHKDNDQGQNLVFSTDATQEALSEVQERKHDNNSSTNGNIEDNEERTEEFSDAQTN